MEQIKLKANLRAETGKAKVKKMRTQGLVPAVVYHRGEEPVPVTVNDKEIMKILQTAGGENVLISLTIEKEKKARPRSVIIKEIQHDPVKRNILHVDFNEISMNEKIIVEVEVVAEGEPVGVKQEGGLLEHVLRELKVQCLPADIPKQITIDVSGLKINESVHVRDLHPGDKIKILNDPDTLLVQVKLPVEEKPEEEAAAPELEVIREKKEEAVAASAPAGEKPEKAEAAKEPKKEEKTR